MFSKLGLGTRSFLDFGNAGGTKEQKANAKGIAIESIRLPYRPGQTIVLSLRERNVKAWVEDVERGVVHVKWVSGLPLETIRNAKSRQQFFSESFPVLSQMGAHYRLAFFPEMLGGVGEGRLGPEVLVKLRQAIRKAREANLGNKDVVGLIGITGVGKSTMINHLLGCRMAFQEAEMGRGGRGQLVEILPDRIVVDGIERAPIGHKLATSETLYAVPYELDRDMSLVDCGGFLDTRGVSDEITVVSSLKLTLEGARSVRLGICIDYNVINSGRATSFFDTLNIGLGRLLVNYRRTDAVFFVFTKALKNGRIIPKESIIAQINRMIEELGGESAPAAAPLNYVIRENGRYIFVYDPLNNDHRQHLLELMRNVRPIAQPANAFNAAYSSNAMLKILEEVVAIAVFGNNLFRRMANAQTAINQRETTITQLTGEVQRKKEAIGVLRGNATDEQYAQAEANLREANERTILEVQREVAHLNGEIRITQANLEALTERVTNLDLEGEQEECYWQDPFVQKGINIETKNTTITNVEKSGWFSSSSSTTTQTNSTFDKRSIEKEFRYKGPEIARIELFPEKGSPCWSDELRESHAYSIKYRTGEGEDADALLNVFVQKKHFPLHVSKRAELMQSIATDNQCISDLRIQIYVAEKRAQIAQHGLEIQGSKKERIDQHEADVENLEQTIQEIKNAILGFEQEIEQLNIQIQDKHEDFQFLNDYLEVCQDNNFKRRAEVVDFKQLQQNYHG